MRGTRGWIVGVVGVLALVGLGFAAFRPDKPFVEGEDPPGSGRGIVEGRVIADDGSPVEGAMVTPASLDRPARPVPELAAMTSAEGRYRWSLEPGEYELVVSRGGESLSAKRVSVRAGETSILDFRLEVR